MAKGKYEKWLEEDNLALLEGWARRGLTDEQIAHNMGINVKTLYDWKKKYSKICNALKKGKEVADLEVESALYRKACGYYVTEFTEEYSEKDGKKTKKVKKYIPPDTTAQIFWLKNRRPDLWLEKPTYVPQEEVESDGLIDALNKQIEDVCDMDDDSSLLPLEDAD